MGSIAQKVLIIKIALYLVAIRNYNKSNFSIYVETDEDFEVTYDDSYHAYIQVKGQKNMSLKSYYKKQRNDLLS